MIHARFDTPTSPRVADNTTSLMSAIRQPFTRDELQDCKELQDCNSPKRSPGDILRVLSPSETFSPATFHDQDQDQDGWNYGETGDGQDTKRESKKRESKKMLDKVSNLFQRATSHGRSPNNKHSISSVSSYSANMFRIDISDPSTLGMLGDDHYETDDDGNERLRTNEGTGEQDDDIERCNPPEITDAAEEVGVQADAVEEGTGEEEHNSPYEDQGVDEIG